MRKKRSGKSGKFNPSGPKVHPKHRVTLQISIDRRRIDSTRGSTSEFRSSASELSELSEIDDESDLGEASDYKSTRKSASRLPYSPKKSKTLRARKNSITESADEDEYRPRATRTRAAKSRVISGDSDYEDSPRSRPVKRKIVKKAVRPEYGKIRNVEDPYDSDPDTAPLRAHRGVCEKCRRVPAHILLRKHKKKMARKKKKDEGMSEDDEDFYLSLGGWVQWYDLCTL